ncbi:MAG TPA: metalloregulator ArsR/SmtB family transcription factor [Thermomicrobiales bacterium]|nr:metalloregulator ArsR/SmtB family transcription factor [Thermomicrobiales bacterium]
MATSTQADVETQAKLAALADPTRLAIVDLLRRRDHCVCHLVEVLQLKQSVISHHVGILRRARLVEAYPHASDRRWLYYRLDRASLRELSARLGMLLDQTDYDPVPLPCAADTGDWKQELVLPNDAPVSDNSQR